MAALACSLPPLSQLVQSWIQEDAPSFDFGGAIVGEKEETAALYCKSNGVLAGVPFVNAVFKELDCRSGIDRRALH